MRNIARVMSLDPCIKLRERHYNFPLYRWDHRGSGREETCPDAASVGARTDLSTCNSPSLSHPACSAPMIQVKTSRLIMSNNLPKGSFIESCRMRICPWVCSSLSLCSYLLWIELGSFRNRDFFLLDVFVFHEESRGTEISNRTVCTLKHGQDGKLRIVCILQQLKLLKGK